MKYYYLLKKISQGDLDFVEQEISQKPELVNAILNLEGSNLMQLLVSVRNCQNHPKYESIFRAIIDTKEANLYIRSEDYGYSLLSYLYFNIDVNQNNLNNLLSLPDFKAKEEFEYHFLHIIKYLRGIPGKQLSDSYLSYLNNTLNHAINRSLLYKSNINIEDDDNNNLLNIILKFSNGAGYLEPLLKKGVLLNIKTCRSICLLEGLKAQRLSVRDWLGNGVAHVLARNTSDIPDKNVDGEESNLFLLKNLMQNRDAFSMLLHKNNEGKCCFEIKNLQGDNIWHLAAKRIDFEILDILLMSDSDTGFALDQNSDGNNVLHILAQKIQERKANLYRKFLNSTKIEEDSEIKHLKKIINLIAPEKEDKEKANQIKNNLGESFTEILENDLFSDFILGPDSLISEAEARLLLRKLDYRRKLNLLPEKNESFISKSISKINNFFCLILLNSELPEVIYPNSSTNSINIRDSEGNTALHVAMKERNINLALGLIRHNANIYISNKKGDLPIHVAAKEGEFEENILKVYNLRDFSLPNHEELNVYQLLSSKNHEKVCSMITESGFKSEESLPREESLNIFSSMYYRFQNIASAVKDISVE